MVVCMCVSGMSDLRGCDVLGRDDISCDQKLDMIRHHLSQLPPAHYHTLKYLMAHLHRSVVHADAEKHRARLGPCTG